MIDKEIMDALCFLHSLAKKDKEFETQTESFKQIVAYIEDLETKVNNKWIPCEERLPSENGTYLVTDKVINGECISYKTDTAYFNGETWHSDFVGICNGRKDIARIVIAWQPLPTPYKKEGAE